jgi:dCMP deaminase
MASAKLWADRSTCSRSQVGVVIAAPDNRILSTGYNGAPAGMPHCTHTCTCSYERERQMAIINKQMFTALGHEDGCHGQRACEVAVHAEANSIAWAARHGIWLEGSSMFTTLAPCLKCAQLIINAGILTVYYNAEYRITDGLELLGDAGLVVIRCSHE